MSEYDQDSALAEIEGTPTAPEPVRNVAADLLQYLTDGSARVKFRVENDLQKLVDSTLPSSELAHIYASLRDCSAVWDAVATLIGGAVQKMGTVLIPEAFERDSITTFSTSTGYRVSVSTALRASINKDKKTEAYEWLRVNELADLITETVNAQTLAAAGRAMLDEGKELPEELFNTFYQQTTSLTKIPAKKTK